MPLTRKQQWRRVRIVRHENAVGDTKDSAARCKRPAGEWSTQRHRQHGSPEDCLSSATRVERSDSGSSTSSSGSSGSSSGGDTGRTPERNPLENWRLPKEGREPSARPGVCAARRQANAACVRVGSRVSFNTIVAAILIPSAKDLHAAARKELWWQETDYRDFRINFIQFMRTPPAAVAASGDGPELVPVEIVAESESTPVKKTQQEATHETNIVQQPVVVDVAAYEGAGATEKVRVWPVPEEEAAEGDETSPANTVNEQALSAATAAAVVVAAAVVPKKSAPLSGVSDTDTSPPSPPSEPEGPARSDGGDSDELVEAAAAPCLLLSSKAQTAHPEPARAHEETETTSGSAAAAAGEAVPDGSWTNEERTRRTPSCSEPDKSGGGDGGPCSLGWSSPDEGNEADEEEEEDDADNGIRTRRSFSNLETARRGGAGLTNAIVADDSSDGDDSCDGSADDGGEGHRPRALSLDGWFTCGLENGVNAKSYETHDHAGRLRDLVKLNPIPAVCATPPQSSSSAPSRREVDLNDALRRLGANFNVNVDGNANGNANGNAGTKQQAHGEGGPGASRRKEVSSLDLSSADSISSRASAKAKLVTPVAAPRSASSPSSVI